MLLLILLLFEFVISLYGPFWLFGSFNFENFENCWSCVAIGLLGLVLLLLLADDEIRCITISFSFFGWTCCWSCCDCWFKIDGDDGLLLLLFILFVINLFCDCIGCCTWLDVAVILTLLNCVLSFVVGDCGRWSLLNYYIFEKNKIKYK